MKKEIINTEPIVTYYEELKSGELFMFSRTGDAKLKMVCNPYPGHFNFPHSNTCLPYVYLEGTDQGVKVGQIAQPCNGKLGVIRVLQEEPLKISLDK